jgi:hypothetical protein
MLKGFSGIRPIERTLPLLVVFPDIEQDLVDQFPFGLPDPSSQHIPGEGVEPDLDLIYPEGLFLGLGEGQVNNSSRTHQGLLLWRPLCHIIYEFRH